MDSAPWILSRTEADAIWEASYDPVDCPHCGHIEVWWDGMDNPHCMKCDPPSQAGIEFMRRARAICRRIEKQK